jgi:glycosyltransferase involved in cell wall biosynthesis
MQLLLIVDSYTPDTNNAASRLMGELGQAFANLGHQVTLLAPHAAAREHINVSIEAGLNVIRVRTLATKNQSYTRRAIAELFLPFLLMTATREIRSVTAKMDAIVWYSPSIFLSPLILWLKLTFKSPAFLIIRDMFPDWAVHTGVLKPGLSVTILSIIARVQFRLADVIALQARGDAAFLPTQKAREKSIVLPNWAAPQLPLQMIQEVVPFASEPWFLEKKILVVGGAVGPAQDPMNLYRLAHFLSARADVVLLILCDHPDPSFVQKCEALERSCVIFKPSLSLPEYDLVLRHAYAGIISLNSAMQTHNIPGRYLSHLANGLPTVASVNHNNELIDIIRASNSGIAHANGDDDGLHSSLANLLDNKGLRDEMAKAALKFSSNFSPRSVAETVLKAMENRKIGKVF